MCCVEKEKGEEAKPRFVQLSEATPPSVERKVVKLSGWRARVAAVVARLSWCRARVVRTSGPAVVARLSRCCARRARPVEPEAEPVVAHLREDASGQGERADLSGVWRLEKVLGDSELYATRIGAPWVARRMLASAGYGVGKLEADIYWKGDKEWARTDFLGLGRFLPSGSEPTTVLGRSETDTHVMETKWTDGVLQRSALARTAGGGDWFTDRYLRTREGRTEQVFENRCVFTDCEATVTSVYAYVGPTKFAAP